MSRTLRACRLAVMLAACCAVLSFAAPAQSGGAHTHARLMADVQSIRPGSSFTVGVLLSIDPGWHIYWSNPGEAGLATEIRWTLPEGLTADPILWPLPGKHIETGDVLTFGYEGETMLLVPVHAGAGLKPGTRLTLRAGVNWLECENICVPGSAAVALTLPVASGEPAPDNEPLFARYRAMVPVRQEGGVEAVADTAAIRLTIVLPAGAGASPASVDFYPAELPGASSGRVSAVLQGNSAAVTIPMTPGQPADSAQALRGVLVVAGADGRRIAREVVTAVSPAAPGGGAARSATGLLDREFITAAQSDQRPLLLYIGFALIGGLLLNIMPCVLPVIALKIFGLVRMAGDQPARVRRLGLAFSAGILASFLLLAALVIVLQAAGQQVGWGFQFQEPLFVIAMGAVVFAFGLSLFGVFEIRLPARAIEGVGSVLQKQERGSGYGASFSEGVFATVLATPCTAPFLGTALGFAFSQPAWAILLIFAAVAAGMALPYILLTARPAWMKFLPKPGEWMVTAKQFMGFLMMATLLWLLYVLGMQLGVEGVVWTGAFLLTIGLACWMIGRFLTLSATRGRTYLVWALALAVTIGGYLLFITPLLEARTMMAGAAEPQAGTTTEEHGGIVWEVFTPARLEDHLRADRAVLLDFTAEWCLTCKVNEKTVLAERAVVEKINRSGIVPVRADWTNRNPDITRLLAKFGRSGVPLYVLFPAGRPSEPIILPEVITPSMVIEAIEKAVARTG